MANNRSVRSALILSLLAAVLAACGPNTEVVEEIPGLLGGKADGDDTATLPGPAIPGVTGVPMLPDVHAPGVMLPAFKTETEATSGPGEGLVPTIECPAGPNLPPPAEGACESTVSVPCVCHPHQGQKGPSGRTVSSGILRPHCGQTGLAIVRLPQPHPGVQHQPHCSGFPHGAQGGTCRRTGR